MYVSQLIPPHMHRFNYKFAGFNGVLAGFSVALKQLKPETELLLLFIPLRAKVYQPTTQSWLGRQLLKTKKMVD